MYESVFENITKTSNGYELVGKYYYSEFSMDGDMTLGVYNNIFKEKTFCEVSLWNVYLTDGEVPEECQKIVNMIKLNTISIKTITLLNQKMCKKGVKL